MSIERDNACHLRRNMTDAEKFVWNQLRGRRFAGFKFRRQAPIGPYIADFVCFERRVIVELDGAHHCEPEQRRHDALRTAWLARQGFRVLRFTNGAVMEDMGAVEEVILEAVRRPASQSWQAGGRAATPSPPAPLPRGERGEVL
jgi:very-short-patch-repair endonuclease